jgi:GNAT superfamily N-acetyltransferase
MFEISRLNEDETLQGLAELSLLFSDVVTAGASMGYMWPFPPEEAARFWRDIAQSVGRGDIILLVARVNGRIEGSVQIGIKLQPNQPHRGELKKLMVGPNARGMGLSRALMEAAERETLAAGRDLLVLDTATGEPAEKIYERFGWTRAGVIPRFALFPDGRNCDTTVFYKELG